MSVPGRVPESLDDDGLSERQVFVSDRVLTWPNLLSIARLCGVPVFLWLVLGPEWDGWALVLLMVSGITDWLDGKLARLLDQYSTLGALLDPAVDRLYILAALVALGVRDVVPWWAVAVLVARDLVLAACLPVLRARGFAPFQVVFDLLRQARQFPRVFQIPFVIHPDDFFFLRFPVGQLHVRLVFDRRASLRQQDTNREQKQA